MRGVEPLGLFCKFWNRGEDVKGILGMPITTTLSKLAVGITGDEGTTTLALGDKGVDGVKFKDIIGALGMFDSGTLTCRGDTPPTNMDEVGV